MPDHSTLVSAMQQAALDVLPLKPKLAPPWFTASEQTLRRLIDSRDAALNASHSHPSPATTDRLRQARANLQRGLRQTQSDWVMSVCQPVNDGIVGGSASAAAAWQSVKTLKAGLGPTVRSAPPKMQKQDGTRAQSAAENAAVFADHFEQLYGRTPSYDPSVLESIPQREVIAGLDGVPTDSEIRIAVSKLKDSAPGVTGVTSLMWKALLSTGAGFSLVHSMVHTFWETGVVAEEWETGLLAILPKKGDLSIAGNHRGIMMLEKACNIIGNLMHARLEPTMESLDHESQCGFRRNRGCSDAIFNVSQLIAKRREHGLETWVLFLDLLKAFDRVPRELLWLLLLRQGVSPKLVDLLKALHATVKVKFEIEGIIITLLSIIGVKQGDLLGPLLFTFFIQAIMSSWRDLHSYDLCIFRTRDDFKMTGRATTTSGDELSFTDSEYADDSGMAFTSRRDLDEQTPKVLHHFERFGMEVHRGLHRDDGSVKKESKTEVLFCPKRLSDYNNAATFDDANLSDVKLPNGGFIPIVSKFCYLGRFFARSGGDATDVDSRIESAGKAFGALRGCVFSSTHVNMQAKKAVYLILILAVLLYGSETWCSTEKILHRLRCFHARCVRAMCRVTRKHCWDHHISTVELERRLGLDTIDTYISRRQLRWLGHVRRMDFSTRLPRRMLSCWVPHPRPVGAPLMTYGRSAGKAMDEFHIDRRLWHELAADRSVWRETLRLGHPPGWQPQAADATARSAAADSTRRHRCQLRH